MACIGDIAWRRLSIFLTCLMFTLDAADALISLQNGTQFYNVNAGYAYTPYFNITSNFTRVVLSPSCQISFASPSQLTTPDSPIILIIWAEASQNGCKLLSDVIAQTDHMFGNQPYVAVVTSSFQNLADYSLYDVSTELFGMLLRIPKGFITLVTNESASDLLTLPEGTVINVISNPNLAQIYFLGSSWLGYRWFFFSVFALFFIYGTMLLVTTRKNWMGLKYACFCMNWITSACKMIELGVDPNYSTMLLTFVGWNLMYWVPFISYVVALQIVLLSWVKVTVLHDILPASLTRALKGFLYFFICFIVIMMILVIIFSIVNRSAYFDVFFVLIPFVVIELISVIYSGFRVLILIKTNMMKSPAKLSLIRKNTLVMLLQVASFTFILVVLAIYAVVQTSPVSFTAPSECYLGSGVNAGIILGMAASYFFYIEGGFSKKSSSIDTGNFQGIPNSNVNPSSSRNLHNSPSQRTSQSILAHESFEIKSQPDPLSV